jgi:hypothetical protein
MEKEWKFTSPQWELLAEEETLINIIPFIKVEEKIKLISGTFGPFNPVIVKLIRAIKNDGSPLDGQGIVP